MFVCHLLWQSRLVPMGILLLSSEFAIQVPGTAGDLFLCPSEDATCPSNLLAGTSLKAGKGVAMEGGGLQRVRTELVTLLLEDFPFPSSGPSSRTGCQHRGSVADSGSWTTWSFRDGWHPTVNHTPMSGWFRQNAGTVGPECQSVSEHQMVSGFLVN